MSIPKKHTAIIEDQARLAVLQKSELLDSVTEQAYNRFTKLAATLLDTPVSLVSLVDKDRQFFKSYVGLPEPVATERQTPLSHSFCQYVVSSQEPLIVGDATKDKLLKNNGATLDLGVIAYLGFPLIIEKQALGSLCVIDTKPREWSDKEIAIVKELAAFVTTEITLQMQNAEHAQIEQQLRESNERLRLALKAGKIGVWDWNIKAHSLTWNTRVYQIHEVTKENFEVTFENFVSLIHPEDRPTTKEAIDAALRGDKEFDVIFRIITPKGRVCWIATSAAVIRDARGRPIRMLGATSDITEQKKIEENKSEFLGIASHELKTPVTSIKAYAQILHNRFKKAEDHKSAEIAAKMNNQLDKLTTLISDLLDVTKIESGKLQFRKDTFDLNELVSTVSEDVQLTADKQIIKLTLDSSTTLYGDSDRIGQVLTNLLSNAIKYAPHSTAINVKTKLQHDSVIISVEDFGIGLTPQSIEKIFQRFFRVEGDNQSTYPGLGLGLYISYEIVKRHDGKMWVESEEGKGSTFFVQLPLT